VRPQSGQSTAYWVSRNKTDSQTADHVLDTASNSTPQDFCKRLTWIFKLPNMICTKAVDWTRIGTRGGEGESEIADQTFIFGNGVVEAGMGNNG